MTECNIAVDANFRTRLEGLRDWADQPVPGACGCGARSQERVNVSVVSTRCDKKNDNLPE